MLSALGRHDEAIAIAKRAVELDPDNPNAGFYAYQLGYAGRYAEAIDVLKRMLARFPKYMTGRDWLALLENAVGDPTAAISQLELSESLAGSNRLIVWLPEWAYGYGRAGRHEDSERIFEEIKADAARGARPGAGGWAMAYLATGDRREALDWLEKAAKEAADHEPDEGFFDLMVMTMNVTNDPVLKQPEFADVLSRIEGD